MPASIIVWDIETIPDLRGFAAANGLTGKLEDEMRTEMGDKFPKLIYHSIVCIGALVAQRQEEHWAVSAVGAPNIGERSEKEIISAFDNRIADLTPQLVTFNGAAFDLPVLRYRAMVCGVGAPGLAARAYFNRYTEDAIDLCDVLSSFISQNKPSLHKLCRVMGLPGKPDGMGGADVERYCRAGRIAEVAAYCETDVVNTYRVWLRYELFRGRLTENGLRASEANLSDFLRSHSDAKPHLGYVLVEEQKRALEPGRTGFQSEGDGGIFRPDTPGARALAVGHAGALAFSRTGDPATGEFQDAVVLAQFGEVDLDSLSE